MILIALGANLPSRFGEPLETLEAAAERIHAYDGIRILKRSPVYISAPVPISDQPWYHNSVICVEADLEPAELLSVLHDVEADFGRVRGARNEARILDLDIIAYDERVIEEDGLIIPHPRLSERAFVVLPLNDIAPMWKHPVSGLSIREIAELLPKDQDIRVLEEKSNDAA